jgi:hypothetical protein
MAPIAIVFGTLLTILAGGTFGYVYQTKAELQYTALIPAGFGILLMVLGFVARNEKARMHAMHGAALLGLIGFAVPTVMVARALLNGNPFDPVRHGEQSAMALLCVVFLGLCVKSFIDARVARKKRQAEAGSAPSA